MWRGARVDPADALDAVCADYRPQPGQPMLIQGLIETVSFHLEGLSAAQD
jgi:hypothetical protein